MQKRSDLLIWSPERVLQRIFPHHLVRVLPSKVELNHDASEEDPASMMLGLQHAAADAHHRAMTDSGKADSKAGRDAS